MLKKIKEIDKVYWITIGAVVAACLIVFIFGGVFPFGNNTFGCFDFYYQVIDITSNIFNAGAGRSSLFFSFDFANGMSFYGNIFYSCISPFTFLMLLGGRGGIRYLFPLMITLKFITIACVALYFIRRYFKNINRTNSIIFALFYAFSGYTFLALTQPDWLDFLIYLPFVFIAFDVMKKTGKIRWLALTLSLLIATSFSLGMFMIFYGLIFFFFYLIFVEQKGTRAKICAKTLLSVAIAIFSTLWITIPCFIEVLHSKRVENILYLFNKMDIFRNFISKVGFLLPNLLFIIPSIILVKKNWEQREGKFYVACLILIFLPVVFDNINVAINFSYYAGYSNRLGALYSIVFLCLALKYQNEKTENFEAKRKINGVVLSIIVLVITQWIAASLFIAKVIGKAFVTQTIQAKYWLILGIFYLIFALICILIFALKKVKTNAKHLKIINYIVCFVMIVCQAVMFMSSCIVEIGEENYYYKFQPVVTAQDKYANVSMNLPSGQLSRGWSSIFGFSSLMDKNTAETYWNLGYSRGDHNIGASGNVFADMLSGIRYRISDYELNAPYLTEVARVGNAILYEYNMCLSHAYFVDELPKFDNDKKGDFVYNQNQIYKAITGDSEDLIEIKDNLVFSAEGEQDKNMGTIYRNCTATLNYESSGNELLYLCVWAKGGDISFNQNPVGNGSNFIKFCSEPKNYSFEFDIESVAIDKTIVYTIDYNKLTDFYRLMQDKMVDVTYTKDSISAALMNGKIKGKYLVINHPSIYGYEYFVGGEKANVESFAGFIAFDLTGAETAEILVEFSYPSVKIGLISLVVGVVLVLILLIFAYNFDKLNQKFLKFINIAFYVFVGALAVYYFIVPFIFKIF